MNYFSVGCVLSEVSWDASISNAKEDMPKIVEEPLF